MNNANNHSKPFRRNITRQAQTLPARAEDQHEVIAGVLKRCGRCGRLEAE